MLNRRPPAAALAIALVLTACGDEGASAPGGVSPGEAKALEDAASMLDERRLPPEALATAEPSGAPPADDASASPAEMTGDAAPARQ